VCKERDTNVLIGDKSNRAYFTVASPTYIECFWLISMFGIPRSHICVSDKSSNERGT
jgi:hypothetical protein